MVWLKFGLCVVTWISCVSSLNRGRVQSLINTELKCVDNQIIDLGPCNKCICAKGKILCIEIKCDYNIVVAREGDAGVNFGDEGGNFGDKSDNFGDTDANFGDEVDNFGDKDEGDNIGDERDNFSDKGDNMGDNSDNLNDKDDNVGDEGDNFSDKGDKGDNIGVNSDNLNDKDDNNGDEGDNFSDKGDNFSDKGDNMGDKRDNLDDKHDNVGDEEPQKNTTKETVKLHFNLKSYSHEDDEDDTHHYEINEDKEKDSSSITSDDHISPEIVPVARQPFSFANPINSRLTSRPRHYLRKPDNKHSRRPSYRSDEKFVDITRENNLRSLFLNNKYGSLIAYIPISESDFKNQYSLNSIPLLSSNQFNTPSITPLPLKPSLNQYKNQKKQITISSVQSRPYISSLLDKLDSNLCRPYKNSLCIVDKVHHHIPYDYKENEYITKQPILTFDNVKLQHTTTNPDLFIEKQSESVTNNNNYGSDKILFNENRPKTNYYHNSQYLIKNNQPILTLDKVKWQTTTNPELFLEEQISDEIPIDERQKFKKNMLNDIKLTQISPHFSKFKNDHKRPFVFYPAAYSKYYSSSKNNKFDRIKIHKLPQSKEQNLFLSYSNTNFLQPEYSGSNYIEKHMQPKITMINQELCGRNTDCGYKILTGKQTEPFVNFENNASNIKLSTEEIEIDDQSPYQQYDMNVDDYFERNNQFFSDYESLESSTIQSDGKYDFHSNSELHVDKKSHSKPAMHIKKHILNNILDLTANQIPNERDELRGVATYYKSDKNMNIHRHKRQIERKLSVPQLSVPKRRSDYITSPNSIYNTFKMFDDVQENRNVKLNYEEDNVEKYKNKFSKKSLSMYEKQLHNNRISSAKEPRLQNELHSISNKKSHSPILYKLPKFLSETDRNTYIYKNLNAKYGDSSKNKESPAQLNTILKFKLYDRPSLSNGAPILTDELSFTPVPGTNEQNDMNTIENRVSLIQNNVKHNSFLIENKKLSALNLNVQDKYKPNYIENYKVSQNQQTIPVDAMTSLNSVLCKLFPKFNCGQKHKKVDIETVSQQYIPAIDNNNYQNNQFKEQNEFHKLNFYDGLKYSPVALSNSLHDYSSSGLKFQGVSQQYIPAIEYNNYHNNQYNEQNEFHKLNIYDGLKYSPLTLSNSLHDYSNSGHKFQGNRLAVDGIHSTYSKYYDKPVVLESNKISISPQLEEKKGIIDYYTKIDIGNNLQDPCCTEPNQYDFYSLRGRNQEPINGDLTNLDPKPSQRTEYEYDSSVDERKPDARSKLNIIMPKTTSKYIYTDIRPVQSVHTPDIVDMDQESKFTNIYPCYKISYPYKSPQFNPFDYKNYQSYSPKLEKNIVTLPGYEYDFYLNPTNTHLYYIQCPY